MENNFVLINRFIIEEFGYSNRFVMNLRKNNSDYLEDKRNDFNSFKHRLKNITQFKGGQSFDDNDCDWIIIKEGRRENIYMKKESLDKIKIIVSEHLQKLKKLNIRYICVLYNDTFKLNHYKCMI